MGVFACFISVLLALVSGTGPLPAPTKAEVDMKATILALKKPIANKGQKRGRNTTSTTPGKPVNLLPNCIKGQGITTPSILKRQSPIATTPAKQQPKWSAGRLPKTGVQTLCKEIETGYYDPDTKMEDAPPLGWPATVLDGGLLTGWDGYCDVEMIDIDAIGGGTDDEGNQAPCSQGKNKAENEVAKTEEDQARPVGGEKVAGLDVLSDEQPHSEEKITGSKEETEPGVEESGVGVTKGNDEYQTSSSQEGEENQEKGQHGEQQQQQEEEQQEEEKEQQEEEEEQEEEEQDEEEEKKEPAPKAAVANDGVDEDDARPLSSYPAWMIDGMKRTMARERQKEERIENRKRASKKRGAERDVSADWVSSSEEEGDSDEDVEYENVDDEDDDDE